MQSTVDNYTRLTVLVVPFYYLADRVGQRPKRCAVVNSLERLLLLNFWLILLLSSTPTLFARFDLSLRLFSAVQETI